MATPIGKNKDLFYNCLWEKNEVKFSEGRLSGVNFAFLHLQVYFGCMMTSRAFKGSVCV